MNAYEEYLDNLRRDLIEPLSEHIVFEKGLTWKEQEELEHFHGIHFPKSLMDFYACAYPAREKNPVIYPWNPPREFDRFPDWRDCSEKNVKHLRDLLEAPVKYLVDAMKRDSWQCDNWVGLTPDEVGDTAPRLIPVYGHRYMPMSGVSDPVFSIAGRDIIYYGADLFDYLRREFLEPDTYRLHIPSMPYVPVWGDVPRQMGQHRGITENCFPSIEKFLEIFTSEPLLLNESAFRFASDPISPKQPGFVNERMIGWVGKWDHPYWIGGCDDDQGAKFDTAEDLLSAPVFDGRSLGERWNEVIWLSLMSISPREWMEMYQK